MILKKLYNGIKVIISSYESMHYNIPSCTKGLEGSFRKAIKKRFRGKYTKVEKERTELKVFRSTI